MTQPEEDAVHSRAGGSNLLELVRVIHRLQAPDGCPWDREQTHQSLVPNLLEEAHETLEAIDSGDPERLREELGDLLLQVIFHAEIASRDGAFDIDDVAETIVAKLIKRHPHVFANLKVGSAAEVLVNWERIKAEEKGEHPVDHEIPATLPALARASKVQRRAAGAGFDWRTREGALAKVHEELAALGRRLNVDPESALRKATARFAERFDRMKSEAAADGVELENLSEAELLSRFRAAR